MSDNVTHLPEPGVVLDLDNAERSQDEIKDPFVVRVSGKNVTFADPNELDWETLASIDRPGDLVYVSLSSEDRDVVFKAKLPGWKFKRLLQDYYDHYGLEDMIREAQRRSNFGA